MNFTITVRHAGDSESWTEDYNVDRVKTQAEADDYGRSLIERFNATLMRGEHTREFLGAQLDAGDATRKHDWRKQNSFTQTGRGRNWDIMKCEACGITGRRYGLGGVEPTRDKQWKAKKWNACSGEISVPSGG